jgi:tryptophanyl-tRNA synthetase
MTKRYLSGIQPSGDLHLGNYYGAIRQHIQNQDHAYYFLADYHALTTLSDPAVLRRNTIEAAATYLALGLDPHRATLFRQSDVPEVTELAWLLATVTGKGLLDRAVSYKEKVARGIVPSLGLYTYPVLMAADILIYDSEVVPVGSDQVQHVEMCRDMGSAFNAVYGPVFKLPRYEVGTPVPVPGIDGQKMSKSYGNTIPIFASDVEIRRRVMSIVTDSASVAARKDPDRCTIFRLYSLVASPSEVADMRDKYRNGNYGYGDAKKALLERILETFAGYRVRFCALVAHPEEVDEVLRMGATRAREAARTVINSARKACGLGVGTAMPRLEQKLVNR